MGVLPLFTALSFGASRICGEKSDRMSDALFDKCDADKCKKALQKSCRFMSTIFVPGTSQHRVFIHAGIHRRIHGKASQRKSPAARSRRRIAINRDEVKGKIRPPEDIRRTYGHQKSTYIRESQSAIRNGKQNPATRMNTGVSGNKLRQAAGAENSPD